MREARPDVIYVSMCGFGHDGPDSSHVTMGPTAQALTGLTFLVGLPDRPPAGWTFSYLDHVGGYLGCGRDPDGPACTAPGPGEGQYIDVSQLEPATALSGAILLDALVNHRPARREGFPTGNRRNHPPTSPGGAYRTAGDDKWIVISCRTEAQWLALVARRWATRRGAATRAFRRSRSRVANADELDRLVEEWTTGLERYEAMDMLQAAGVPAGVVQDAADRLERDPATRRPGALHDARQRRRRPDAARGSAVQDERHPSRHRRRDPPRAAVARRGHR